MTAKSSLVLVAVVACALSGLGPAGAQPMPGEPSPTAPPAAATPGSPQGGRGYGRAMTLAQYQVHARERTLQADTDHDGRVSLAEWTAYQAQRAAEGEGRGPGGDPTRRFQLMDADRDGYVTAAEIDAASARRFARMDANHDGVVTPEERRAMRGDGMGGEGAHPPPPQ